MEFGEEREGSGFGIGRAVYQLLKRWSHGFQLLSRVFNHQCGVVFVDWY